MSVAAAAVARYGLPGATPEPTAEPPDDTGWAVLLREARFQRLTGLLAAMVIDGALRLSDEQAEELTSEHLSALARDLAVERALLWAVACLDDAGVDHRVLKGAAVAHLDYPDPAQRSFLDVDILIRSVEWDRAVAALAAAGARRMYPEPRPGWDRRYTNGTVMETAERLELDLHRTLVFGRFGYTLDLDGLWAGREELSLGGRNLRALAPEGRWLQACFSAALSDVPPRLVPLREVVQLAGGARFDPGAARRLVEASGAAAVVQRATTLATTGLAVGLPPVLSWVEQLTPTRRELAGLGPYLAGGDRWVALAVSTLWALPGLRAKLGYATGMLWPKWSFVEGRYTTRRARWVSAAGRLRAASDRSRSARRLPRR